MLFTNKIFIASALFFTSAFALADSYRLTDANYFLRSNLDFGENKSNVVGVLTSGSTFKVLSSKKFSNGAEALQIRAVGLTAGAYVKPSDTYWILKANTTNFIKLDSDNSVTQSQVANAPCEQCEKAILPKADSNGQNRGDIANISKAIIDEQNKALASELALYADKPTQKGSLDEKIKKYSESAEVQRTIDFAMKRKSSHSRGACHRSVKNALACTTKSDKPGPGNCLTDKWYPGVPALGSKNSLKKLGFINLLEIEPYKSNIGNSPSKAPKGSVLIYSSGIPCSGSEKINTDCGHAEIKTNHEGKPGYVSDYYSKDAINQTDGARRYGSKYRLVGVMIKP